MTLENGCKETYVARFVADMAESTAMLVSLAKTIKSSLKVDKQVKANGTLPAGVPVAMGTVDDMDVDGPATNGASKRKSRGSIVSKSYKEASSDDDDMPLVGSIIP